MDLQRTKYRAGRRPFLKWLLATAGLPFAGRLSAAAPEATGQDLKPGDLQKSLHDALGGKSWTETDRIDVDVPASAENGAIVPITVESRLPDTDRILIFGEKNPGPLLAHFDFAPGTDPWVSLRLKLNDSGQVLVIAKSAGKFYGVSRQVRVMKGGCG